MGRRACEAAGLLDPKPAASIRGFQGERMEFTQRLGIREVSVEPGKVELELDADEAHGNTAERTHGGVLFSMLDTAMGRAAVSTLPEGRGCATLECKINFFRPVTRGRLSANARVVTRTRRTAYTEGSIVDPEGRMVARATATFFLTETRVLSERERV